jgi:hypothetical protein
MKLLVIVPALIEVAAGLVLLLLPSQAALPLGSPLGTPTALVMGRLAGVAAWCTKAELCGR